MIHKGYTDKRSVLKNTPVTGRTKMFKMNKIIRHGIMTLCKFLKRFSYSLAKLFIGSMANSIYSLIAVDKRLHGHQKNP